MELTFYGETKTLDSQTVRSQENLKLSHGGPSQRRVSGTNQPIKVLGPGGHWIWGLTHGTVIKGEGTIAVITVIGYITRHAFCNHLDGELRADCFTLTVFLIFCGNHYFVTLPHCVVGWSAVCDCGTSWSYSLAFMNTVVFNTCYIPFDITFDHLFDLIIKTFYSIWHQVV